MKVARFVSWALFTTLFFVLGRLSMPEPARGMVAPQTPPHSHITLADALSSRPASGPRPKVPRRGVIKAPLELAEVPDAKSVAELQRSEQLQAEDVVSLLRGQVRKAAATLPPGASPESAVAGVDGYLSGWVDAMVRVAPTLADDLAGEVESELCDPESKPEELMLFARLGRRMPELMNSAGMQCLFSRHGEEDVVTWEALDALKASALPAPPALGQFAQRAHDERSLRRLHELDPEAQAVSMP